MKNLVKWFRMNFLQVFIEFLLVFCSFKFAGRKKGRWAVVESINCLKCAENF
jgi:hypothetical protein